MKHQHVAALLIGFLVVLALVLLYTSKSEAAAPHCSEFIRKVCCPPACATYKNRNDSHNADAQLAICLAQFEYKNFPQAAAFCGCRKA